VSAPPLRRLERGDPGWPESLAHLGVGEPKHLYVRGEPSLVSLCATPSVAMVGARSPSAAGERFARTLARELAEAGVSVISGLALGIDAACHAGALEGAGRTVAVLGCGIDRDYPRRNAALAKRIAERGAIVSEWGPGVEPAPWRFPARNRIVAGLCDATVVVEARERSGALITADLALDEGREVLAVPGEITSLLSKGTNHLLRLGAVPVTCLGDVLAVLGVEPVSVTPRVLAPRLEAVRTAVADVPAAADELVRKTGLSAGDVAAALAELELAGAVVQADGLYRVVMPVG
jgi:DNA processing protein